MMRSEKVRIQVRQEHIDLALKSGDRDRSLSPVDNAVLEAPGFSFCWHEFGIFLNVIYRGSHRECKISRAVLRRLEQWYEYDSRKMKPFTFTMEILP